MQQLNGIPRVLVIDDNPNIHEDFRKILPNPLVETGLHAALATEELLLFGEVRSTAQTRPVFDLSYALQGQEGAALVAQAVKSNQRFALAFVDMRMPPGWDGLQTIEELWRLDPFLQVVICSAHSDYDWSAITQRLGHSDKLLILKKPFESIEVLQCASSLTCKWQSEQNARVHLASLESMIAGRTADLEAANGQLRTLATHDALTGLPNRILLDDRLSQAMAYAKREQSRFGLMLLDLDRFKFINDSLGHRAGDALLCEVARRLIASVRESDTVARIGGDEFVLLLSPLSEALEAEQIGARVLASLQAPFEWDGVELRVTPSIGIAYFPTDAQTADNLVARADAAMYQAKERGRNNLQCFDATMDAKSRDNVQLESDLHSALRLGQFELHYQPKADIRSGQIHSAEALLRWRHPVRGLVAPNDFIPLAERNGLIVAIGEWVVREACRQAGAWQAAGCTPVRIAVNVAAAQFRHGNLLETVRSALASSQLDPIYLELELTESAVMTNPEESTEILTQLRAMGVLVSVDDFGTGYSSMGYLRQFPIDKLKIDRCFIRDFVCQSKDASIVQAIISLAHDLKLKVVAEGVETLEQLQHLQSMGCDQYQGYHLSAALPAPDFMALVQQSEKLQLTAVA
jgi:diguanylate cyclase (GGDEF)-like protein